MRRLSVVSFAAPSCLVLAGRPSSPPKGPFWSRAHWDPANTGQVFVGKKPATVAGLRKISIGAVHFSVTCYFAGRHISCRDLRVTVRSAQGGQLISPAVDGAGNIYDAQYLIDKQESHLLSLNLNASGSKRFDVIPGKAKALSPPKVVAAGSGPDFSDLCRWHPV